MVQNAVAARVEEPSMTADDWKAAFDERAGILEFSANLSRREAEDRAWKMTIDELGEPPAGLTLERLRK